ncbi:MAG: HAD family phosphatase [Rikenellaceae bacterium]
MLTSIKNIIFDLGGVVIDLDRERCVDSFTRIGFPEANTLIDSYHPVEFFNSLERGTLSVEEVCDKIREIAGKPITNSQICEAYSDFLVEIPVYKLRMIEALRQRGFKLMILSNTNPIVFAKVLELFAADGKKMEDYFDAENMYLSYQMGCLKPEDEIYEKLLADSGVVPAETLFIDDSDRNIEVGAAHGLQVYLAAAHEDFSHIFENL